MLNSVCFIGHKNTENTEELQERLKICINFLIENKKTVFIFGDHSRFNTMAYDSVSLFKKSHPDIYRIHFRKNYEDTDEYTLRLLKSGFEESFCPKGLENAGKAAYIERNNAMIDESEICVFYYDDKISYSRQSGTQIAFNYAVKKKKKVINLFNCF